MAQIKFEPVTKEDVQNLYKAHGKESKLISNSGVETFMPEKVIFGAPEWQDLPNGMGHFRIATKNADNETEIGTVSLSRIHVLGVKKVTEDQVLSEKDVILRAIKKGELKGKKTYMINGSPLNPAQKLSEDETILNLQGKTFKAVKCTRFNVPYSVWDTKEEAVNSAGIAEYYELYEVPKGKK